MASKRRELSGRLDMRWLDFTAQPIHVVEANGWVILEHATEARDARLCQIPQPAIGVDLGLNLRHQEAANRSSPGDDPSPSAVLLNA